MPEKRRSSEEGLRFCIAGNEWGGSCGTNVAKGEVVNQHSTDVKTNVKSIALLLAMFACSGAAAQPGNSVSGPAADTVLLSERVEGDYLVRRLQIQSMSDVDYSIRYRISAATLNAALAGNPQALDELNGFVDGLLQDTLKKVTRVVITGYASPDGPVAYNKELAARRANDFKNYLDQKYGFSKKYAVTVHSEADDWKTAHAAIASSSVPDRASVLQIIDGTQAPMAKEQALKRLPGVWSYLAREVLPPMRRVEVMIDYDTSRIVEERTRIQRPAPAPAPAAPAEAYVVVEEDVNGVIVAMPDKGEYRKAMREATQEERHDVKATDRIVKHDSREIGKISRAEAKAAKRIAKKEAKAAKKAARAAKKTTKDLEKMK